MLPGIKERGGVSERKCSQTGSQERGDRREVLPERKEMGRSRCKEVIPDRKSGEGWGKEVLPLRKERGRGRGKEIIPDRKPREGWEEGNDPRDFSYTFARNLEYLGIRSDKYFNEDVNENLDSVQGLLIMYLISHPGYIYKT